MAYKFTLSSPPERTTGRIKTRDIVHSKTTCIIESESSWFLFSRLGIQRLWHHKENN